MDKTRVCKMEADCAEKMQLLLFFREISEKRMFAIIIVALISTEGYNRTVCAAGGSLILTGAAGAAEWSLI